MLRPSGYAWRSHGRAKHGALRSTAQRDEAGPVSWVEAALHNYVATHAGRDSFMCSRASDFMHYVYLLRSLADPSQIYVGYSTDLKQRLRTHHAGGSPHTSKYGPWRLVTYLAFIDKFQALEFERYLKSHSGKAFAAKRLWPQ